MSENEVCQDCGDHPGEHSWDCPVGHAELVRERDALLAEVERLRKWHDRAKQEPGVMICPTCSYVVGDPQFCPLCERDRRVEKRTIDTIVKWGRNIVSINAKSYSEWEATSLLELIISIERGEWKEKDK